MPYPAELSSSRRWLCRSVTLPVGTDRGWLQKLPLPSSENADATARQPSTLWTDQSKLQLILELYLQLLKRQSKLLHHAATPRIQSKPAKACIGEAGTVVS